MPIFLTSPWSLIRPLRRYVCCCWKGTNTFFQWSVDITPDKTLLMEPSNYTGTSRILCTRASDWVYEWLFFCFQVQDKFRLDLSDEEAVHYMQSLIDESVGALFAAVVEQIHKFAQVCLLQKTCPFTMDCVHLTCYKSVASFYSVNLSVWWTFSLQYWRRWAEQSCWDEAELDRTCAAGKRDRRLWPDWRRVCVWEDERKKPNDTVKKAKNALPTFTARWLNKDMDVSVCLCTYNVY